MGPSRGLRRGFSLEVIFEEDSDFCSHSDSLDSVNCGAPTHHYPDQISVDSLVEEEEDSRDRKRIHRRESLEEEELTKIELLLRHPEQKEKGRRGRDQEDPEEKKLATGSIESTSFDAIFHLRDMESCLLDWDQTGSSEETTRLLGEKGQDREPMTIGTDSISHDGMRSRNNPSQKDDDTGDIPLTNNGRLSRVSRREILSASWLTKEKEEDGEVKAEDDNDDESSRETPIMTTTLTPPLPFELGNSPGKSRRGLNEDDLLLDWGDESRRHRRRGSNVGDHFNTPNFDSNELDSDAGSTLTNSTDTDSHIYAIADPTDEVASIASSTFDCSESMTTLTRCPLVDMEEADCLRNVKRVREMFESGDSKSAHQTNGSTNGGVPTLPPRNPFQPDKILNSDPLRILLSQNTGESPKEKVEEEEEEDFGGILKDKDLRNLPDLPSPSLTPTPPGGDREDGGGEPGILRSAYSSFNLHRLASYDFVDLLVNDRVVIEDSPDIFQFVRSTRQRQVGATAGCNGGTGIGTMMTTGIGSKWDTAGGGGGGGANGNHNHMIGSQPILRRSKSMGTGIFVPEESTQRPPPPTTILAEEIQPSWPAPNIVKNVRNVFEQLCLKNLRKPGETGCVNRAGGTIMYSDSKPGPPQQLQLPAVSNLNSNFKPNGTPSSPPPPLHNGSSSFVGKQFLSSVKSNPTSKIFRSESLRDNGTTTENSRGFFKSLSTTSSRLVKTAVSSVLPGVVQSKVKGGKSCTEKVEEKEQVPLLSNMKRTTTDPPPPTRMDDKVREEKKMETILDNSKSQSSIVLPKTSCTVNQTTSTTRVFSVEKGEKKEEKVKPGGQVPRKLLSVVGGEEEKVERDEKMLLLGGGCEEESESSSLSLEEQNSLLSSIGEEEEEEPKWIPEHVLSRIRSHGTTTTYFGGEIVGKTVKNRKLLVSSSSLPPDKTGHEQDRDKERSGSRNGLLLGDNGSGSGGCNGIGNKRESVSPPPCLSPVFTELVMSLSSSTGNNRPMTKRGLLLEEEDPPGRENEDEEEEPLLYCHRDIISTDPRPSLDTVPRIVSVLPKSPPQSKSTSPSGSIIEGRNSPDGCESQSQASMNLVETLDILKPDSNNNIMKNTSTQLVEAQVQLLTSNNNNNVNNSKKNGLNDFKFSEIAEGAWF